MGADHATARGVMGDALDGWGEDKNDLSYHRGIAGEAREIGGRERAQNMDDKLSRPGAF